jgi:hypothetical protein
VLVKLCFITELIRQLKATLLLLSVLVDANAIGRMYIGLDTVNCGREGYSGVF